MRYLPTAVLEHTARTGRHYDLLVQDPAAPPDTEHNLWAVRLGTPPQGWDAARRLLAAALTPHRARYLTYQGVLSGHRGRVVQIDRGQALAYRWVRGRIVLGMRLRGFEGVLELRQHSGRLWVGRVMGKPVLVRGCGLR